MELDLDRLFVRTTPLSLVASVAALAGVILLGYGQFHVSVIEFATGSIGVGEESLAAASRARLEHYRTVRSIGVALVAGGAAVTAFDAFGGTRAVIAALRRP